MPLSHLTHKLEEHRIIDWALTEQKIFMYLLTHAMILIICVVCGWKFPT